MDQFIANLKKFNQTISETKGESTIRNTRLVDKQLFTYYVYRIFCKNIDIFKSNTSDEECNKVLRALKIPINFKKCTPLTSKMTNDIGVVNSIFEQLLNLFEKLSEKQKTVGLLGDKKKIDYMIEFIETQFDIGVIRQNLVLLSSLVPELGKMKTKSLENL